MTALAALTLAACATVPTASQPRAAIDKDLLESIGPVRIQFVRNDHWGVADGVPAKALRTNTDPVQKWVLINLDSKYAEDGFVDLGPLLMHEIGGHHGAWDKHGEDIEMHGPEFDEMCERVVTDDVHYFCGGG